MRREILGSVCNYCNHAITRNSSYTLSIYKVREFEAKKTKKKRTHGDI